MMEWWNAREPREQLLVSIAAGLAIFALILQLLILPVLRSKAVNATTSAEAAQTLDIVSAEMSARRSGISADGAGVSGDDLRAGLVSLANRRGLSVSRVQGNEGNGVTLAMDAANPELFFAWLADIEATYNVTPSRLTLADNGAGAVRSSVSFAGAGS